MKVAPRRYASAQRVATVAWSYARAAVYAPDLFQALADVALDAKDDLLPVDVANIAWGFAAAGETDRGDLYEALFDRATSLFSEFKPHELANVVWSYAGLDDPEPCRRMWALMFSRPVDVAAIDDVAKSQLQQAYVRLTKDARVTGEIAPLPAPDRAALVASFRETDSSLGSRTQKAVSNALTQIGWDHLDEHYDAESGLSLDMAQLERKTAVEFDGPARRPSGGTRPSALGFCFEKDDTRIPTP